MPYRKITLDAGEPKVSPAREDYERLSISEYGKVYLGRCPDSEHSEGGVYKLHKVILEGRTARDTRKLLAKYCWIAMWNTCSWTSVDGADGWNSIEDALKAALKSGWNVAQVNYDEFKFTVDRLTKGE